MSAADFLDNLMDVRGRFSGCMYGQFNGCHSWGGPREARLETRSPRPRVGSTSVHVCWICAVRYLIPPPSKNTWPKSVARGGEASLAPPAAAGVLRYPARYCCIPCRSIWTPAARLRANALTPGRQWFCLCPPSGEVGSLH